MKPDITGKLKAVIKKIKRAIPYRITRRTPELADKEKRNVYLAILEGGEARDVKEVNKKGDDMVLEYNDKECAITSKPLRINGTELYFTRDGFLGTMPLNKHTLLEGDVYHPSKDSVKIDLGSDAVEKTDNEFIQELGLEDDDYEITDDNRLVIDKDDGYTGTVSALHGSKATLKEMNEARRLRKLLQPSGMDNQTLLLALGSGAAVGFILAQQMGGM